MADFPKMNALYEAAFAAAQTRALHCVQGGNKLPLADSQRVEIEVIAYRP